MSYQSWLSSLGDVCNAFINWLSTCANSLMSNYIVITIIGISLFFFLFNIVLNIIDHIRYSNLDDSSYYVKEKKLINNRGDK